MIGRLLAHYQIIEHLGSGGMGDVYQATDTKLGRSVALKFLPEAFAHDAESAARFQREARALASLNHPRIAAIHGVEEADGRNFLVMEFVPGQTLAERIGRAPLPLNEALNIARQITEALEAAHEKGIVHRDLKPANVKITPDGQVKVLDFGLAKLGVEGTDGASAQDMSAAVTMTAPATQSNTILGTAAYMAPEQAKGQPVDRRADIFAFGCVLYEMLTGQRAFAGENVPDILSRVLQSEPDSTRVPSSVPPSLQRLMRLCLEKDPRKRRQTATDVRLDIEQALTEPAAAATIPDPRSRLFRVYPILLVSAVVLLAVLAIPAFTHLRETPPPEMRLEIVTPPSLDPLHFALSPDGRNLVFVGPGPTSDAPQRLYLRALDKTAEPMPGTDGARYPFWSPDSRSVGFFARGKLFRIEITGGPAQELALAINPLGGTWGADGTILYAPTSVTPLLRVPAKGGDPVAATQLDSPRQNNHRLPSFLPDGRQFVFYALGNAEVSGVYLGSLDGGTPKRLTAANSAAAYLAPDRLVFVQDGALVARRIDTVRGELTGDPVTLAASVGCRNFPAGFSISATGIVAFRTGCSAPGRLTLFDHKGKVLNRGGDLNAPSLSPDGHYVALDRTVENKRDVWILDLERGGLTPFTRHPAIDGFPVWSRDGSRIAMHSQRNGTFDIWINASNGVADAEQLLLETPDNEWPVDWGKDDRFLLYHRSDQNYASSDLWALPMTGDNRTPIAVATTRFEERMGNFSPDGRWVAYETEESGQREVVVQAFPDATRIVHVSTGGGSAPRWSADGSEIYFIAPDGKMMAVPVATTGSTFNQGKPVPLFATHIVEMPFTYQYVVSRDGQFLVNDRQVEESSASPITLILNWRR